MCPRIRSGLIDSEKEKISAEEGEEEGEEKKKDAFWKAPSCKKKESLEGWRVLQMSVWLGEKAV